MDFHVGLRRTIFNKNLKEYLATAKLTSEDVKKEIGLHPTRLSQIINFRLNPKEDTKIALAVLLGVPIEDIFPEKYDALYEKISPAKRETAVRVDFLQLDSPDVLSLEAPIDVEKEVADKLEVESFWEVLSEKERDIVKMRHGFDDNPPMTYDEVAKAFSVTRERIRQIEAKALEKIRQKERLTPTPI